MLSGVWKNKGYLISISKKLQEFKILISGTSKAVINRISQFC